MTRPDCQKLREELHGYRMGEGTPLARQKLELHLKKCAGCNNELYLLHELEQAARVGPPALTDANKRNILNNIHRTLRQEDAPVLELSTGFDWRKWFALPAAGFACAAALLMVLSNPALEEQGLDSSAGAVVAQKAETATPTQTTTPLQLNKVLAVGPGVVAFQTAQTKTLVRQRGTARTIDLSRGAMVAEFNRAKDQDPLEIVTPHATIIIRGTVFAVNTGALSTTVAVNRGKVEVRSNSGDITMLLAGQSVEVGDEPQNLAEETKPLQVAMTSHFGTQPQAPVKSPTLESPQAGLLPSPALDAESEQAPEYSPTQKQARPAAKAASKKPAPGKKPKPKAAKASAMELLQSARTLWRDQKHSLAIEALESLLSGDEISSLNPRERDEARYLLATIHRAVGDYGRAATLLRVLSTEKQSMTGRMAQLELARLEARHLGHQSKARSILEGLVSEGKLDIVAEESLFELCALYIKNSQWTEAKSCLQNFLTKFSQSERSPEARDLFNNLPKH